MTNQLILQRGQDSWFIRHSGRIMICHCGLDEWITVPKVAKTLYVTASNKEPRNLSSVLALRVLGSCVFVNHHYTAVYPRFLCWLRQQRMSHKTTIYLTFEWS